MFSEWTSRSMNDYGIIKGRNYGEHKILKWTGFASKDKESSPTFAHPGAHTPARSTL
uniref:Uncharacterized protein n=1 Tax=Anguilla anguilla TaxID=7936 RepID=A0A0E9S4E1_ANGAN